MSGGQAWSENKINQLSKSLGAVFLEEWGGPRSPLALQYLHDTVIPDLVHCFMNNEDLLGNGTFIEVIEWKLKSQFGYPPVTAKGLAVDLVKAAKGICEIDQISDPKEPWRRIFRLWVSGESLPAISERTCYPLEYLDLLHLRYKRLGKFVAGHRISLLECLQNEEFREFGWEQLSFLYQFYSAIAGEPLYKERMVLEQVIADVGLPIETSDLIALLEVIHTNEGKLNRQSLSEALREYNRQGTLSLHLLERDRAALLPAVLNGLINQHWILETKAGKLTLGQKSAQTIAGFLIPKLSTQVSSTIAAGDIDRAREILFELNPEVLIRVIDWIVREINPPEAVELVQGMFKKVNRMVDLHIVAALGKHNHAYDFLAACLEDRDSLVRAKACETLGSLGNKQAVDSLIQILKDPVVGVREQAVKALGRLKAVSAEAKLQQIAADYAEAIGVRESAVEALQAISRADG